MRPHKHDMTRDKQHNRHQHEDSFNQTRHTDITPSSGRLRKLTMMMNLVLLEDVCAFVPLLICVIDDVCEPSSSFKDSRQFCSIAAALGCGRLLHPSVLNSMRVGPGPDLPRTTT